MDLAALRSRLSDYLNDTSTQRWSQATRDAFLNIAYREICNADNWPFREAYDTSISTVSGTSTYAMPSNLQLPLGVWLNAVYSPNKLFIVTRKERELFNFSSNGKPLYYFLFADSIVLYPTPDTSYTLYIEYQKRIADLVLTTDTPIFDYQFHHLIALLAAAKLIKTSGGAELYAASDLSADVTAGIEEMRARLMPRDLDRQKSVNITWDNYPPVASLDLFY